VKNDEEGLLESAMTMLADLLDPSRVAKGLPTPKAKTPNALSSLMIDEVSLVHQGANEGAVVILAKPDAEAAEHAVALLKAGQDAATLAAENVILKARLAVLKGEQALPVRKAVDPAKVMEPVAKIEPTPSPEPVAKAGVMKAAAASLDELVAARRASHGGTKARLMTRC
jgi:hypothetical protein